MNSFQTMSRFHQHFVQFNKLGFEVIYVLVSKKIRTTVDGSVKIIL